MRKRFTLTAAWCSVKVKTGLLLSVLWVIELDQIWIVLSFPPLARYCPPLDHFNPQTSWLCPLRVPMWWSATRTSWWCIRPTLEPPLRICEFQLRDPTLEEWLFIVRKRLMRSVSQSWMSPLLVPTAKWFPSSTQETDETYCSSSKVKRLVISPVFAFHKYISLMRATARILDPLQSISCK